MVAYAPGECYTRTYQKNHSRNLNIPLCGIFCPNSVAVDRYGALIRTNQGKAGTKKMEIMDRLNKSQTEAVTATEGYIRVIAGAGSGKTRALSHRFAFLVNEIGILPGNILCVTFTNKSANEMRQRIHNLTGDNDTVFLSIPKNIR